MLCQPFAMTDTGVMVHVRATTKALCAGATGSYNDGQGRAYLSISVTVPATKGRANQAIIKELAKICGVAQSRIALCTGARGRQKRFHITGNPDVIAAALVHAAS